MGGEEGNRDGGRGGKQRWGERRETETGQEGNRDEGGGGGGERRETETGQCQWTWVLAHPQ